MIVRHFNISVLVGDNTMGVRKMKIGAKTPSLGKGAAACEVAGRGLVRYAFSLNPFLHLPRGRNRTGALAFQISSEHLW